MNSVICSLLYHEFEKVLCELWPTFERKRAPPSAWEIHALVFSIRLYPTALECDAYICGKCRFIFNQWKALSEFSELVSIIDGFDEVCSGTGDQIEGKSQNNLCFEMTVKELLFSG
jgi:hypothetical protein